MGDRLAEIRRLLGGWTGDSTVPVRGAQELSLLEAMQKAVDPPVFVGAVAKIPGSLTWIDYDGGVDLPLTPIFAPDSKASLDLANAISKTMTWNGTGFERK